MPCRHLLTLQKSAPLRSTKVRATRLPKVVTSWLHKSQHPLAPQNLTPLSSFKVNTNHLHKHEHHLFCGAALTPQKSTPSNSTKVGINRLQKSRQQLVLQKLSPIGTATKGQHQLTPQKLAPIGSTDTGPPGSTKVNTSWFHKRWHHPARQNLAPIGSININITCLHKGQP